MKVWIFSKRTFLTAALCLVLGVFSVIIASSAVGSAVSAATTPRKIPIYCVEKQEKIISISFDAAWGNEDTQQLIDILAKYNIKATFFVVGQWVDKYPASVKALSDAGHEIENHSNTHPHMPTLSRGEMLQEIKTCNDKIESVTGKRPTLLRAPYGDYNNALVDTLQEMNMHCIQWDVDSLDWKNLSSEEIYQRVTSSVKSGSIVLFHNAAKNTPEALPRILEKLLSEGYQFVPISQLIDQTSYDTDHEGRQHSCSAPSINSENAQSIPSANSMSSINAASK